MVEERSFGSEPKPLTLKVYWANPSCIFRLMAGGDTIMAESEKVGTVKWFNSDKGFGFIKGPDDRDVFVHKKQLVSSGIIRDLQEGEQVRFTAKEGPKGFSAVTVRVVPTPVSLG